MPLIDITNPDIIKFLVENYDKTARLRMKWNNLNADKLKLAATLTREEKGYCENDVLKANMSGGMPAISRDHIVAGYNRRRTPIRDGSVRPLVKDFRRGHSIVDVGLGDPIEDPRLALSAAGKALDPIMRPVDPEQKDIIYKGIPDNGRLVYLKSRSRMKPETKYYFKECSGWGYGWRLNDSFFNKRGPCRGRVWRLARDVKSRTGPYPDPPHYKDSDIPGPSKCPA